MKHQNNDIIVFKKVGIVDKYNFYEYISVMLDGGVGVTEALESVYTKIASPYFKIKIQELITYVSSGDSFSKSMKKVPQVFTPSETSIIESGEQSGKLTQALMNLSDEYKKTHELKNKVRGALTYPIIIFLFLIVAIGVVFTFVIPAIKPLFENADTTLPFATQALVSVSDFVVNNFFLLLLFVATVIILLAVYFSTNTGRASGERFLLRFPLFGKVYRNYILARIASNLSSLVASGIGVIKTLGLTGKSTGSLVYERFLEDVIMKVSNGSKIVDAIDELDPERELFTPDYIQMLSVGEKTASIDVVGKKLARQYEKEVDYALSSLTKWIEPVAILFAAGFVLWFAFAIFGAILKITQAVG